VRPEDEARLTSFVHDKINMLGRYSFAVPVAVARGELRPLRDSTDPLSRVTAIAPRTPYFLLFCLTFRVA
jgi:hypothetical protein